MSTEPNSGFLKERVDRVEVAQRDMVIADARERLVIRQMAA
jgi:hypothetical protein